MIKLSIQKNSKKVKLLIVIIALVGIILGNVLVRNILITRGVEEVNYKSSGNTSSLIASYIRKGVNIGGITGTLDVLNLSDATVEPYHIREGKTAYNNRGEKIMGTYKPFFEQVMTNDNKKFVFECNIEPTYVAIICNTSGELGQDGIVACWASKDAIVYQTNGYLAEGYIYAKDKGYNNIGSYWYYSYSNGKFQITINDGPSNWIIGVNYRVFVC